MPRQAATVIQNTFVKGLITENTAFKFPEDACTETFNCVFDETGVVSRRMGFEQESGTAGASTSIEDREVVTEYLWTAVAGDGDFSFSVVQKGSTIHFYDVSNSTTLGSNKLGFTVDLNTYLASGSSLDPAQFRCAYASGRGDLVVVNSACDPIRVSYNLPTAPSNPNTISVSTISLQYRDFDGLNSGLATINTRPTDSVTGIKTSNPNHYYNLLNQGWYAGDALSQWDTALTSLPSNADVVSLYRASETDAFDNARVTAQSPGNTPAPKGHFILDVHNPNRATALTAEGFTGTGTLTPSLPNVTVRPQAVEFYAGRVWYAGIEYSGLSNNIYFTQIIENNDQYGRCYQKQDPTSEDFSDLLADDGGVVRIPEIGTVVRLFTMRSSLVVYATNGVWIISGGGSTQFKPNDYSVQKISSIGTTAAMSLVDVRGIPLWWGEDGIYTIQYDANYNSYSVQNLTDQSIKTFFQNIPPLNRRYAKGALHMQENTVYWLYNNTENLSDDDLYTYNAVLVMNSINGAFYPWTITQSANDPVVRGILYIYDANKYSVPEIKYVCTKETSPTLETLMFAGTTGTGYTDWPDYTDTEYLSYFMTGYMVHGEGMRYLQPNYVTVFLNTVANSSCFMYGVYDWTNSTTSNKWSTGQEIYNSALLHRDINYRRLKVRGKGKAMQLRFESQADKPFEIIGWSIWESMNAQV